MFYSIFATLFALLGAYSQTSSLGHDFKHLSVFEKSELLDENETEISSYNYSQMTGTSVYFTFDIEDVIYNETSQKYHSVRYYISANPSANTYVGYLDFYCEYIPATQQHNVAYYLPTLSINMNEQFNYELQFSWRITNSAFPSVPLTYSYNVDFSTGYSRVVYLLENRSELISSTYINQLSCDLMLTGVSMTQEQFNAVYNAETNGYEKGYGNGYEDGIRDGYQTGYSTGFNDAGANTGQPAVIFSGILAVALLPVNFFLTILNFEVFGINIGGFITGLLTLAIIMIIWRVILGGKVKS